MPSRETNFSDMECQKYCWKWNEKGSKKIRRSITGGHALLGACNITLLLDVSIWSASYSLEKNSGSGEGVISFTNQAWTCTSIVHVISQLIGVISRLGLGLVTWYFGIVD